MKGSRFLFRDLYGLHETRACWGQDYDFIFKMVVKRNFVYTYFHHSQDATKPFLRYLYRQLYVQQYGIKLVKLTQASMSASGRAL